ncbi:hypothetical protein K1T71_013410 [Dendrolimus kikuchii]|uniref:Uncharacterized protein n=1 Tax=Dendrolimus kikuchii TaxID=765133 RepID=A0ACC1CI11_9NEOP|nr:hypothetical protein K1T71_013410 [Dendrolimus kikuchii]
MTKSKISAFWKQCFVTSAICSNTIGHGSMIGFPAVLLPQLHQADSAFHLTKEQGSWIASVVAIAMVVGSFFAPPIMGRLGRKIAHFTVTAPILLGWIIVIFSNSFEALIIGRISQGISFGMMLPLRSVLIGEFTSPKYRGAFLTTVSVAQGIGIFLIHLLGSLLSWRTTAIIFLIFPFASLVMIFFSPESPSWLADKGKYEECKKVFKWLRDEDEYDELDSMIQAKINNRSDTKIANLKDVKNVIKKKEFYKPILLMTHTYFMGEFSGGALMACYSTVVITIITGKETNAYIWMIALDVQRIISNTIAVFAINKFNRRSVLFFAASICITSHLLIAGYVYFRKTGVFTYDGIWIPIILINMQYFTVAAGMISLPYVIAGEIFPLQYRSIGSSISIVTIAGGFFIVTKSFPGLVDSIGFSGTYLVYAGVLVYNLVVVGYLLPETRGKTLQQIEDEFKGKTTIHEDVEVTERLQKDLKEHKDIIT